MKLKMILVCLSAVFLISCGGSSIDVEKQKEYANALKEKGLFSQAIAEFKKLIDSGALSKKEQGNISYIIGKVYMENLRDYENALASFIRVKVLLPDSDLAGEVNVRTVECLERLGKPLDAQQEMEKTVTINKKKEIKKDTVVAKIRNRSITKEELDNQLRNMPPYIQDMCKDDSKKLEFLRQYVATELMYDSAKRKNFENDKEIVEKAFQAKKGIMVQKLFEEEIKTKIKISDSDLKNYYEANKKNYAEKDKDGKEKQKTLEEVKEQVYQAVFSQKEQDLYQELISGLLKAEQVTIYEENFKKTK